MIRSLRIKFILINMTLVFIVLAIVFGAVLGSSYRFVVSETRLALQMLTDVRVVQRPFVERREFLSELALTPTFLVRVGPDGVTRLIIANNLILPDETLSEITARVLDSGKTDGVLRDRNLRYRVWTERDSRLIGFADITTERRAIRTAALIATLMLLCSLSAFFIISLFLSRWALRPVRRAWSQQRQFVADASHELKTPITVILANTGILLENSSDTVDKQRRWIENTAAEAGRMHRLVGNLLFLAKSDDAQAPVTLGDVNLSELVLSIALAFEAVAYEKGLEIITADIEPDVIVRGDADALEQLVSILLENALKFSEVNSAVTVTLRGQQSRAMLTVCNRGPALSPTDCERIFDRFYRTDSSRASEGYGLGLSIAKSIVDAHRGKISVESNAHSGTTFFIRL